MRKNIKLTIHFKYREARVVEHFMVLPRVLCKDLEDELDQQAGNTTNDNHVTFGFVDVGYYSDKQDKEIYVQFSDAWARFGTTVTNW